MTLLAPALDHPKPSQNRESEGTPYPSMRLRPTIIDDDGKSVPLVRFNASHLPLPIGPLPRQAQEAMVRALDKAPLKVTSARTWFFSIMMGIMPVLLINLPVFVMILLRRSSLWTIAISLAMLPVAVAIMFWMGPFGWTDPQRREVARAALKSGHCASCGYPLRTDLPPDHLIRCPECAAAWRTQHW